MSEKTINISVFGEKEKSAWWAIIGIVFISVICVIGYCIIIWQRKDDSLACFLLLSLLSVILVVLSLLFISYLDYKAKNYNSTLSAVKTIMVLEKQNVNKEDQSGQVDKVIIDGKVLVSIDRKE